MTRVTTSSLYSCLYTRSINLSIFRLSLLKIVGPKNHLHQHCKKHCRLQFIVHNLDRDNFRCLRKTHLFNGTARSSRQARQARLARHVFRGVATAWTGVLFLG